jgi:ABC-type transporter Mla maintaining outer membrane lipid asymmetry ATPase subunit MlaF/ABC-type transporter Mla maintaining outer membrane lipid asymmetry permease subunit MlaE
MGSSPQPLVRMRGVSKGFGGRLILDRVDLDLNEGRVVVVVGPSGGGKSVLLDLLLGLLRPDAGTIEVDGPLGMVFQDGALFDDLSVRRNIGFPYRGPIHRKPDVVNSAAAAVGLAPGHLAARPTQLSGGLRKRASIARALVQAAPILLYDEPTAGLDAASSIRVAEAILTARDAGGGEQAALVVTHDYPLAARIADDILYLDPEVHRLVPLLTQEQLADYGGRKAAVPAIRDRLEAHFAEAEPPASEPGTDKTPWRVRLRDALGEARRAATALTGVRVPTGPALMARIWDVGVTSATSILASGFVLGLVSALQLGQALGLAFDDMDPLPALLGVVMCHHVGPLYTGLFLAGRVGARVASEVGIKTYLRQADALQTFGVRPEAVWLSPILAASILSFPALAILLEAAGLAGGYFGYVVLLGQNTAGFQHTVLEDVQVVPFLVGLGRAAVTGAVVATVAYNAGRGARRGSDAVGRATTRAVVAGLLGAIAVELVFGLFGGLLT